MNARSRAPRVLARPRDRELPERRRRAAPGEALARPARLGLLGAAARRSPGTTTSRSSRTFSCEAAAGTAARAIASRYLAVELATAVLIAACFARFGLSGEAFVAAFFVACLVVISAIDIERKIIPDVIVLPGDRRWCSSAQIALFPDRALEWMLAALAAAAFLFVAVLVYPRGMGMGDVKLALLMGAMLGKTVAVAMMVGMLAALVASSCSPATAPQRARRRSRSGPSSRSAPSSRSSPASGSSPATSTSSDPIGGRCRSGTPCGSR